MGELPEEEIQAAEDDATPPHDHVGIVAEDGSLLQHLQGVHQVDVPPHLSGSTVAGLHDRLHDTTDAADDES